MTGDTILKVLCLHGYRQDAKIFREKTGSFRKHLKKRVEFVFMDSPHQVLNEEQNPEQNLSFRGWWFSHEDPLRFYSRKQATKINGFDESVEAAQKIFEEQGPFDGILGFSQGACLTGMLCSMLAANELRISFKFAIMVAAFKSLSSEHDHFYERGPFKIPTMHIMGSSDQIIPVEASEELANLFDSPFILRHEGGHCVPSANYKPQYFEFLDSLS